MNFFPSKTYFISVEFESFCCQFFMSSHKGHAFLRLTCKLSIALRAASLLPCLSPLSSWDSREPITASKEGSPSEVNNKYRYHYTCRFGVYSAITKVFTTWQMQQWGNNSLCTKALKIYTILPFLIFGWYLFLLIRNNDWNMVLNNKQYCWSAYM